MHAYEQRFQRHGIITAMMLLTQDDFSYRERYTHISDALGALLHLGVIPIINENDSVAVEEIKFGDNDTLSAQVTNLAEADLLIILSDQDGFHTQDPRKNSNAEFISVVPAITETLQNSAGGAGSTDGTGGMITKLRAAEIVTGSGEIMVLANGNQPAVGQSHSRGRGDWHAVSCRNNGYPHANAGLLIHAYPEGRCMSITALATR